jgi:hypothetical protein
MIGPLRIIFITKKLLKKTRPRRIEDEEFITVLIIAVDRAEH